jgi:alpha-L-rhamnosidase
MEDVREAQRASGAYPDYCPYPFAHGQPGATHGTAWTDGGVIVPYSVWLAYGDTRLLEKHWDSMSKFMAWRAEADPTFQGVKIGNTWGDWLNVNENTPIEYIDLCYHAYSARLMAEMAGIPAINKPFDAARYQERFETLRRNWARLHLKPEGRLGVDTQTAYALALDFDLADESVRPALAARLAEKIAANDYRMATGFLGTKPLLPVLTRNGYNDLAVRLFQSRKFPSWGYEVEQGANSVWERWDSYTREHGFNGADGNQNASMNSFSHYAFGSVMQWGFQTLAGLDTDGPAYKSIRIHPHPPKPGSNPDETPVLWAQAEYESVRGKIRSAWRRNGNRFELAVTIPPNTTATVWMPASAAEAVSESGKPLSRTRGVRLLRQEGDRAVLAVEPGVYRFESALR